jgi:hypothetical protein
VSYDYNVIYVWIVWSVSRGFAHPDMWTAGNALAARHSSHLTIWPGPSMLAS